MFKQFFYVLFVQMAKQLLFRRYSVRINQIFCLMFYPQVNFSTSVTNLFHSPYLSHRNWRKFPSRGWQMKIWSRWECKTHPSCWGKTIRRTLQMRWTNRSTRTSKWHQRAWRSTKCMGHISMVAVSKTIDLVEKKRILFKK